MSAKYKGNNMNIEYIEKNTDMKIEYHETITSTNERAKEIAEELLEKNNTGIEIDFEHTQVVIAEKQTKGKGTNGRVWLSDYKENILMTMIFYPKSSIMELQKITYSIAEMIKFGVQDLYDISLDIKLPNDLLLNSKKICGILTESSIQNDKVNYLLIGIGFNVNQCNFSNEIKDIATSLKKENKEKEFLREEIIVKIINNIKSLIN